MKIEIEQAEIETAIIEYVASQGLPIKAEQAEVDLKAGRGENGMTATISINQGKATVKVNTERKVEAVDEPADSKKLKFGSNG